MNKTASFKVKISDDDRMSFAALSGDYNPLHTNEEYATQTGYKKCILHGAFSAGLLSRMAGMYLPGTECLLHEIRLKFLKPILTPCELNIEGVVHWDDGENGEVAISIRNTDGGYLMVEGGYRFGRHQKIEMTEGLSYEKTSQRVVVGSESILVTGASGGIGSKVLRHLGKSAIGLTRETKPGLISIENYSAISLIHSFSDIDAIVHCAWPSPDNDPLLELSNPEQSLEEHLVKPFSDCLALARLLRDSGKQGGLLVLVGSSFALPGRHAWRMPLYSLSKSLIPTLTKILALELGTSSQRVVGVTFDMLDGGMNNGMPNAIRQANADRVPAGRLPTLDEAARQICWVLDNPNLMVSGGVIDLTGGAIP